jgi:Right handed beta helix region
MEGKTMSRIKTLLFLLLLAAQVPLASATVTYQVGGCLPKLTNFTTISAAVAATPAPDVVKVCAGIYYEQVAITTPLTLEGIASAGSSLGTAAIAPPSTGLVANSTTIFNGQPIAAQVLVETGPVNITNITVIGPSAGVGSSEAGIFYASGSYGTINEVTAAQQTAGGDGVGIWAENGTATMETVTIENSDIWYPGSIGIVTGSNQTPPTLTAIVKGNTVSGYSTGPLVAIFNDGGTGSIASNSLSDFKNAGVYDYLGSGLTISGNRMTNTEADGAVLGIALSGSNEIVKNNSVSNNFTSGDAGISLYTGYTGGARIEDNTIANSYVAIEFDCNTGTVSGNKIYLAATGIDQVPSTLAVTNTYHGVFTSRTDCSDPASAAKAKPPLFLKKLTP